MNSMQLKDKLKNITQKEQLNFNILLRYYMYDCFLERLAKSKYRDNFIIKGGFYLSVLFGIKNRSTMDIDALIKNVAFNQNNISQIIKEIINIDINDQVQFSLIKVEKIREKDEYGGYRVYLLVKYENIKESFHLDIVTGDPITPSAIRYKYQTIFKNKNLELWFYNIETMLAEKLSTIFSYGEFSTRLRDYYDVYYAYKFHWSQVNQDILNEAIKNTFAAKGIKIDFVKTLAVIKASTILKTKWEQYTKKYDFAENISYEEIMASFEQIIKIIK